MSAPPSRVYGSALATSRMFRADFVSRQARKDLILGGDFVLVDTSMEVVLGILFCPLSDANMDLQRPCLEELHKTEPPHPPHELRNPLIFSYLILRPSF